MWPTMNTAKRQIKMHRRKTCRSLVVGLQWSETQAIFFHELNLNALLSISYVTKTIWYYCMQDERGNKTNIGSTYKFVNMPILNPLSVNITKWPNTLKQFVGKLPTNCLCVFDYFVGLVLKGLILNTSNLSSESCGQSLV